MATQSQTNIEETEDRLVATLNVAAITRTTEAHAAADAAAGEYQQAAWAEGYDDRAIHDTITRATTAAAIRAGNSPAREEG